MFYNNSNDLVKKASSQSGRVQNSNETREVILNQMTTINDEVLNTSFTDKHQENSVSRVKSHCRPTSKIYKSRGRSY